MKKKNKWEGGRVKHLDDFKMSSIIPANIGEYNTERVTIFGANMVMARHLPFIIDGLKPVARRTLTSIFRQVKGKPTTMPHAIAETMKIHQHGDTSIYDCIILMAQPWKKMIPLIDSMEENYGSAAGFGDKEADARYLKTRLSDYTLDCFFTDYDETVVEMKPNFDGSTTEPLYLPSKYPNLFINGGDGMAWGYATDVPVYNINDILEYTIHLIKNPEEKFREIIPDSPTGCDIVDNPTVFRKLQYEGFDDEDIRSHTYIMQSVIDKDEDNHTLIVRSFPLQRTTESFFKGIDEMKENGSLAGCTKVKNECQNETIKIILCFKPEVNLDEVRNSLYSLKLGTRVPFAAQITVIDNKNTFDLSVQRYSVEKCLMQWIEYRRDFKRRYYHKRIVESKAKVHEITEMLRVFSKDNYKTTSRIIQESNSKAELIKNLIREYDIDTVQAEAIANMRQYENVKDIRKKYKEKREELLDLIDALLERVKNTKAIDQIIITELEYGIEKYGEPRRSKIITLDDKEDVPNTIHTILVTNNGMIKKLGDRVTSGGKIGNEDCVTEIFKNVKNRDTIMAFDSNGKVHCIPVRTIRGCDLSSYGFPIETFTKENSNIVSVFILDEENNLRYNGTNMDGHFIFTTKNGIIKRTRFSEYTKVRNSFIGIKLKKGDELKSVKYLSKDSDLITFTESGYGLRYNSDSVSETGRNTSGVKAISLNKGDNVRDTVVLKPDDEYLLTVTSMGYMKKIKLDNFELSERYKQGIIISGLNVADILVYALGVKDTDNYIALTHKNHVTFNVGKDIESQYKMGKGNKIIDIKQDDYFIKLMKLK